MCHIMVNVVLIVKVQYLYHKNTNKSKHKALTMILPSFRITSQGIKDRIKR